ncbi:MAG: VOC family protein [Sphingobium sp.]|nr:VOC family protein [Sphingobium sp.]MBP8671776.1 VOC family protein [Sphingobium sp.]MBP9158036.1 VOC family protein [Sphingobium sp.]MCC6480916.1 VOC family protein [Sphingomonadaceae bacterium]
MNTGKPDFRLDHLNISSENPEATAKFYGRALQMEVSPRDGGEWLCCGPQRRVMFSAGPRNQLHYASFVVADEAALTRLREGIQAAGGRCAPSVSALFRHPGAFSVNDPDGNVVNFSVAADADQTAREGLSGRLQHVVFKTRDIHRLMNHYAQIIGFVVSDRVETEEGELKACFLRGDNEHHSMAIFAGSSDCLDHHSYEAGEWALLRDWGDHLSSEYITISWGPGRHGAGNNLFFMFDDPEKNWLEISAELEIIDDRPLKVWEHSERSLNLWGKGHIRT